MGFGLGYEPAGRRFVGGGDQHANTQDLQLRVLDAGCHFAAWQEPALFSTELRAAFRSLR